MKIWKQVFIILVLSTLTAFVSRELKPIDMERLDPLAIKAGDFFTKDISTIILLDVRSEEDFLRGHFGRAIHFDPQDWENSFSRLMEMYKGEENILVYCGTGCGSSKNVVERLREAGFEESYFIHKGYQALISEVKE